MEITHRLSIAVVVAIFGLALDARADTIAYQDTTTQVNGWLFEGAATVGADLAANIDINQLTLAQASAGHTISSLSFEVGNYNSVSVSARPIMYLWAGDGTGGLPGSLLGQFDLPLTTFAAGTETVSVSTAGSGVTVPSSLVLWAGLGYDNGNGASAITASQLNVLGGPSFFPATVGTAAVNCYFVPPGSVLTNPAVIVCNTTSSEDYGWTVSAGPVPTSVAWAQAVNGSWSTALNWTPTDVPTSTISASFNTGSINPYTVTLSGTAAANNLTVQGDTLTFNLGSNQLPLAGSLSISALGSQPGSLTLMGATGGNVSASGGISVGQPTDAKPASAAQYNSLGVAQATNLTGNVTLNPSGQLWGNGTVVGNVANGGLVSPGTATAPGNLQITGNYSQQALGTLSLRVNGTPSSGNFDSINVAGNASLSGSLGISIAGYTPSIGNTYDVLTAASVTGSFNNGSNLAPTGTGFFKVTYSSDAVMVQPTDVITFFADSSTYLGHAFLEMTSASGVSSYYGFYSNGLMPWGFSGHVQPDSSRPWKFSIEYPVSQNSYLAAAGIIQADESAPPNYGLTSFNCTSFIESIATAANIQLPNVLDSHGVPDPQTLASSLQAIGNGNTAHGGTVVFNNTQSPQIVPATPEPVDYSYSGLEQAGHASAGTLASALGLPLDQVNLGTVLSNSTSGISINITNADPSEALISMNWGDGSAYQVQGLTFSHVYAPGTYTADLLDIDDGAVHSYDMTVLVSASASTPLDISVTAFPPNDNVNPGLLTAGPVPGVPEPSTLTLTACGGLLLLHVHHRRK